MGYTDVRSLAGGFTAWKDAGRPFVVPRTLSSDQMHRYSRHVLIPEVGEEGQLKLLDARVLLIGAGGLGSPAALYLAAAGVGTIGLVDSDVVDVSNLQRQVLHTTDRVDMPKVESARIALNALNPEVRVIGHNTRLTPENADEIVARYDIVVDGSDNFDTMYLINEVCVRQGKPNVSSSILAFDGQITTLVPGEGPCYRCAYPVAPPPSLAPSCSEIGVLGVVPGVMGLLQANEVIKLVLGIGEPLVGRLLMFDALSTSFTELKLRRNPECAICGSVGEQPQPVRGLATAS
jgi:molybdopterin/thiamine biosynthesis adenylyltransferase